MDGLPPSARLLGMGFYVALCIVLGTIAGMKLDTVLETGKLLTVAGLAFGLVCGLWGGWLQLQEVLAEINHRRTGGNRD